MCVCVSAFVFVGWLGTIKVLPYLRFSTAVLSWNADEVRERDDVRLKIGIRMHDIPCRGRILQYVRRIQILGEIVREDRESRNRGTYREERKKKGLVYGSDGVVFIPREG